MSVTKNYEAPLYAVFPACCYCLPFEDTSLPQHPVLGNHQSVFLLEQQIKNLQTKIMPFLRGLSFPVRLHCHLDAAKRIAPFNLSSTTPRHDRFFFPLSERLGLNENTSPVLHSSSVHPFLLPVHPKQNCTVSTLCSECDLNSIYSSPPLSPTVAPSLSISHLNYHLCTFILYSLPTQIIKKRAFILLFLSFLSAPIYFAYAW